MRTHWIKLNLKVFFRSCRMARGGCLRKNPHPRRTIFPMCLTVRVPRQQILLGIGGMIRSTFGDPMLRPPTIHVRISITHWVDDSQPGWVEGCLTDAHGRTFSFVEKAPIVSEEELDANSEYPRQGHIAGTLIERRIDAMGGELLIVDTARPWGIEATSGETQFEVRPEQVIGIEAPGLHLMGPVELEACLKGARTIAVLGIKPETRAHLDAHRIPL